MPSKAGQAPFRTYASIAVRRVVRGLILARHNVEAVPDEEETEEVEAI